MTNLPERFWSKVAKSAGPDACWLWTASLNNGYGAYSLSVGRNALAHRIAYEDAAGPIPQGAHVLHRCDNPRCVNPAHLFLGTHSDNVRDMVTKRRHARGETHAGAKLSDVDVTAIRCLGVIGAHTQRDLAAMFGVSRPHISKVLAGKNRG
jgi:hypothetical protein